MHEVILNVGIKPQVELGRFEQRFGKEYVDGHKIVHADNALYEGSFHGGTGGRTHYQWDVIKASGQDWVGTYSDVDHSWDLMDRNGKLIGADFNDSKKAMGLDFAIPRIDKNKDFIDMIDAGLIEDISVSMYVNLGDDEKLKKKYGSDYATKIIPNGAGFVTEGAVEGAKITKILNKKNKMTDDTELLEKQKQDILGSLEGKVEELSTKESEVSELKAKIEEYEARETAREEEELTSLRTELLEKTDISKEKVESMGRETIETILELKVGVSEPAAVTIPKEITKVESKEGETPLVYENSGSGKIEFYAERPAYIPDHVSGDSSKFRSK